MQSVSDRRQQVNDWYRQMLDGHVHIRETIDLLLEALGTHLRNKERPRVMELGCHAGISTEWLLERWPDAEIVVQDEHDDLIDMARDRVGSPRVEFHVGPPETVPRPVDFVVSIARHHHLPHDYLAGVRKIVKPGGVYLLAEELCPEYCFGEHATRISQADVLHIVGGYVFTSNADVESYRAGGPLPAHVVNLENLRRRALWSWYRFVVDHAVEHGYYGTAIAELKSTHDDLITGSDAEHKFSPLVVEQQFKLAGFKLLAKRPVGPSDHPERQAMVVYEFALP
jgi:SAM-dependent methyltransferase